MLPYGNRFSYRPDGAHPMDPGSLNRLRNRRLWPVAALLAAVAPTANAQDIRGRIVDPSGAGVYGADVTATPGNARSGTDGSGWFDLGTLPNGSYTIRVRRLGFEPATVRISVPLADPTLVIRVEPLPVQLDTMTTAALEKDLPRVFERMRQHLGVVQFGPELMKEYPGLSADAILQTDSTFYPYLRSTSFCGMSVYVNGKLLPAPWPPHSFARTRTIVPDKDIRTYVSMRDIAAIEVFRNAKAKIFEPWIRPDEIEGCGSVVLIWTKGYKQSEYHGP